MVYPGCVYGGIYQGVYTGYTPGCVYRAIPQGVYPPCYTGRYASHATRVGMPPMLPGVVPLLPGVVPLLPGVVPCFREVYVLFPRGLGPVSERFKPVLRPLPFPGYSLGCLRFVDGYSPF